MSEVMTNTMFPKHFTKRSRKTFHVTLGIGGNIGDVSKRFKQLIRRFQNDGLVDVLQTSILFKNPPFGFHDQEDFINSVVEVQTSLYPNALLHYLLMVEKRFKRVRTFKNAPRTLDIDILFFHGKRFQSSKLTIPHPHWQERESVVVPLYSLEVSS
jgi:2-amino-4-hydroxy-6-hydroxymethyldihydropteridine diphosphokinase